MAPKPKAPAAKPITPFWDVANRTQKLIISGGGGKATMSIIPKWVRHGAPMRVALNSAGMKKLLKDLAGTGGDGARVKCEDAPKTRYCFVGEVQDGTPITVPFTIVEKAGKDTRTLRVALGAMQVKRLAAELTRLAAA